MAEVRSNHFAARPSMGKTAFALTMARNIAIDFKKLVGIFLLEMSAIQLNRLISSETEIPSDKIKNGNFAIMNGNNLILKYNTC